MNEISGRYSDGRSAAETEVTGRLVGSNLELTDEDGLPVARWPADQVETIDEPEPGRILRLSVNTATDSRLVIEGEANVTALRSWLPGVGSRRRGGRLSGKAIAAIIAGVAIVGSTLYLALPKMLKVAAGWVPAETQQRIGAQTVDQIASLIALGNDGKTFCTNEAGVAALQDLTKKLSQHAPRAISVNSRILNAGGANAFAAPGGHVVLFRGLVETANSPDVIAGVLAHEIGHVALRHPTQLALRRIGLQALMTLMFGGDRTLPGIGKQLLELSYSRDAEREADEIGLELMHAAGFSTSRLAALFEELAKQQDRGGTLLSYLSTHPLSEERVARIAELGEGGKPALNVEAWGALAGICR